MWHGCHKYSEGCANCYVYREDAVFERDSKSVFKTKSFSLPIEKDRKGNYKIPSGTMIMTCLTSDFLLEEADEWRPEIWKMIKERSDCSFFFITKRIKRFMQCIPEDWCDGYDNVAVGLTCENQKRADERLEIFKTLPIKHKILICAPLLEYIDLSKYLDSSIEEVSIGGESGKNARVCNYEWVTKIREDCQRAEVPFTYHQTGSKLLKDGKLYYIKRSLQKSQARKANIDTFTTKKY